MMLDEVLDCACGPETSISSIAKHVKFCLCLLKEIVEYLLQNSHKISFVERTEYIVLYSKIFSTLQFHQAILEVANERKKFPEHEKVQMVIKKIIGESNMRMLTISSCDLIV